jgi:hypothetical protein
MKKKIELDKIEDQIRDKQKSVDYDVKEFTIEILVQKYISGLDTDENDIYIPDYQREFVWDLERQSKFIESVILGLPIPYIFTSDTDDGRLEIIDGSQRLRTLANYLQDNLRLERLDILSKLNGMTFKNLSTARQKKINNSTLRMIVLSDKSDEDARFMLFERINTGSDLLNDMEKRRGIFQGKFLNFLTECTHNEIFNQLAKFTDIARKRRQPEELVLRFFAFSERYLTFKGNLNKFLDEYLDERNRSFPKKQLLDEFEKTLAFVNRYFPNGFVKDVAVNYTPRVRFEALSVGVNLALKKRPSLKPKSLSWLDTKEFEKEITGSSTNTPDKVRSRIEFVRDKLLSK